MKQPAPISGFVSRVAANFFRDLGDIPARSCGRWARPFSWRQRAMVPLWHGRGCSGHHGHGDHLLYGHGSGGASQPCRYALLCDAIAPRARLCSRSDCRRHTVYFLRAMFGAAGALGATEPGASVSALQALVMEVLLTAGLANTILAPHLAPATSKSTVPLRSAATLYLRGSGRRPSSGASMNPIRSSTDLVRGEFATTWLYLIGPFCWRDDRGRIELDLEGPNHRHWNYLGAQGTLESDAKRPKSKPRVLVVQLHIHLANCQSWVLAV